MKISPAVLLLLCLFSSGSATELENQNADSSLRLMRLGKGICLVSLWGSIPGLYDAGLLTMVSSRNEVNSIYTRKYKEAPPVFGNDAMTSYYTGTALKLGGIGALVWGISSGNQLGLFGFPMIMAGAYYQYAAQRDLETEIINCAAMIRDGNVERKPVRENSLASIQYSFPF